jgi:GNAT superfamily N-acetyltransferase
VNTTLVALDVRPIGPADTPAVIALINTSLGGGPAGGYSPEFFAWKHDDNPFGSSPGLVAVHDGRIVGVRLFLRWRLEVAGETVPAVRAVDTATDPEFQGRGIFRRLTLGLLEQLDESGEAHLVFNTPNSNSRPGYLKMGWQPVGTLPVRLCPTRPLSFLRGARTAAQNTAGAAQTQSNQSTARPVARPPLRACRFDRAAEVIRERGTEIEDLLGNTAHTDRLHTALSLRYLRWRYADAPELDYRAVPVDSGGRLAGIAFGRMRHRGALTEFTVGDLVVRAGDHRTARRLLAATRRAGADHVAVHTAAGTEAHRVAAGAGYLVVPRAGVGLVANPRRDTPVPALSPDSWRLSLGDLEVF